MTIHVTPIPKLTELTTPAFTLGTANAAGDAITAVASNSTLLAFDTTLPAATGTAAVGTASTVARRDHVHGVGLAALALSCRVYHNAAQSVANATNVVLAFNSERFDNGGLHDTSTNNSRITFATAGVYYYGANVNWGTTSDTGYRELTILLNGSTNINQSTLDGDAVSFSPRQQINGMWEFDADDYIVLSVFQSTGGAINVNSNANYSPEFWATRII